MKSLKLIGYTVFKFATVFVPSIASAQVTGGTIPALNLPLLGNGHFIDLAVYIINILLSVSGIVAIGFLVYGGFRYIISAGNEESAEQAKKTIQNAIVGLIIIILSYTIITAISNLVLSRH